MHPEFIAGQDQKLISEAAKRPMVKLKELQEYLAHTGHSLHVRTMSGLQGRTATGLRPSPTTFWQTMWQNVLNDNAMVEFLGIILKYILCLAQK